MQITASIKHSFNSTSTGGDQSPVQDHRLCSTRKRFQESIFVQSPWRWIQWHIHLIANWRLFWILNHQSRSWGKETEFWIRGTILQGHLGPAQRTSRTFRKQGRRAKPHPLDRLLHGKERGNRTSIKKKNSVLKLLIIQQLMRNVHQLYYLQR
jgi:hypothetical protein